MDLFNWYHTSLGRKISTLSVILLSFLLLVIVFSIYKLRVIEGEINEVAYIDVPLNQIMSEVEMIQLERHILFEQFRLKEKLPKEKLSPHQEFIYQKQQLKILLDKAINVISDNITLHKIRFELSEHQKLLAMIEHYHQQSNAFETQLSIAFTSSKMSDAVRYKFEDMANRLEASVNTIIQQLDGMTLDAGRYAEKHETEFLFVNAALGICAFILGLLLTVYIIQRFRKRIHRIQDEIQNLDFSIENGKPLPLANQIFQCEGPLDELGELELELKHLMQRLAEEIINREQVEQQLIQLATQDKLTGAHNRHKWDEQLLMHLDLARRGSSFSLILLDIDFFKQINDKFGHHVGDLVLKNLVQTLNHAVRKTDMLFRLGGEEFIILLPMQNAESACQLADRLRDMIEVTTMGEDSSVAYTVSLGVTEYHDGDDEETIFKRVDNALYQAKTCGRNQVRLM